MSLSPTARAICPRALSCATAITRGQRQTGGQGLFRPEDNLESAYARDALRQLYLLLVRGKIEGCSLEAFEAAIAACWAENRKVPQIAFKPDWTRHAKAAPFKRNDAMLEALPIGVIVFPGTGIQENLADKARKLGIPVWKFAAAGA